MRRSLALLLLAPVFLACSTQEGEFHISGAGGCAAATFCDMPDNAGGAAGTASGGKGGKAGSAGASGSGVAGQGTTGGNGGAAGTGVAGGGAGGKAGAAGASGKSGAGGSGGAAGSGGAGASGKSGGAGAGATGGSGGSTAGSGGSAGSGTAGSGGTGMIDVEPGGPRAVWLIGTDIASSPVKTADFVTFATPHEITNVYVDSAMLIKSSPDALRTFIGALGTAKIDGELLFTDPTYAYAANHAAAVKQAQDAVAFVQATSGTKPVALHFDVEPDQLPEWFMMTMQAQLISDYLDLLAALAAVTTPAGLRLEVDLPFWYAGFPTTRNGMTKPLSQWVLDTVDRATFRVYRDTADGADGLVGDSMAAVAYAGMVGKKATIGVDVTCGIVPDLQTFCEEGSAAMETELQHTRAVLGGQTGFGGFAIHDYAAYVALKP